MQDEGALVVRPAFAVHHGLIGALSGVPGSLTTESLRERLTYGRVDGGDFTAWPAASHHPAALWKDMQLLGSVQVTLDYVEGIIPEVEAESSLEQVKYPNLDWWYKLPKVNNLQIYIMNGGF